MSIRTAVVAESAADEAILAELDRRRHNLVAMGVGRRPEGENLFFGETAAALLEKSKRSLLLIATWPEQNLLRTEMCACPPGLLRSIQVLAVHNLSDANARRHATERRATERHPF